MRAVGQTLKEKENYFWYFLNYLEDSVTRRERPDIHNKNWKRIIFDIFENKCHMVRTTGQTQENIFHFLFIIIFLYFYNFQIFCFFLIFLKKKKKKKKVKKKVELKKG